MPDHSEVPADDAAHAKQSMPVKRGRGRPRKHPKVEVDPNAPKRKRGRPRKNPDEAPKPISLISRGRGRPKKTTIVTKEIVEGQRTADGKPVLKSSFQRVDGNYLARHLMSYFTKVVMIHGGLSKEDGVRKELFERLKVLDIQMIDVCKQLLGIIGESQAA